MNHNYFRLLGYEGGRKILKEFFQSEQDKADVSEEISNYTKVGGMLKFQYNGINYEVPDIYENELIMSELNKIPMQQTFLDE